MISLLRHKKLIALIVVGILIFIAWFCWKSLMTAKTNWMTNKVAGNLELGIQIIERDAPRIKVTNDGGYYEPDVNMNSILPGNTPAWSKVFDIVLENLNQDINVPLCKVTKVTLNSTSVNINAYATLEFEVFPGITKAINVMKSVPTPHYRNPTGDSIVN
jgi:hypothetical protein